MRLRAVSESKLALGGDVTLSVVTDVPANAVRALFDELWRQVFVFERRFSRFLPASELTMFNRSSGMRNQVSPEFRQLLIAAKSAASDTGGLYNPFILPALQKSGYKKSAAVGYESDAPLDYSDRRVVSASELVIGDSWAEAPYGTAIDLGGIGKGYLADQLARELQDNWNASGYWLSLGGDITTFGRDENGNNIAVNVQSASNLDESNWLVQCPQDQFAVATSGTFKRSNQGQTRNWHHIIDPTTLLPAVTDIKLATVCAATALKADVLASCAVILGAGKALAFLKKSGAVAAMIQGVGGDGEYFEKSFGRQIVPANSLVALEVN